MKPVQHRSAVPATPDLMMRVRRKIVVLEAEGMTRRQIAKRAGVAGSTITRVASGEMDHLSRNTAKSILEVRPSAR